ncbi:aminotransferase [Microbotryum lychnidis-dioicae p1A1 Lamole]|uniref:Aminotransferase n=1 Tax=Microbotryum lychnidis-dioicae (strain p1A1 Lamole / MvSl-1064) TaxID=683840 RepID=U5H140_USTV1|nr:aminotransferase [Microbotryum lychnidis-dioicae p1A1 Lamole]|eukprot:KDE08643.1 aminotransferase [Microbotryum lychnidis-dioicae p1A1 Lamole]
MSSATLRTSGGFAVSDKVIPEMAKAADVWTVFSPLAGYVPNDALNLGQGFMNWNPPDFVRESYSQALQEVPSNHYSLPRGRINLRNALSKTLSESYGRELNPNTEITVTAGANEGMFAFATAFLREGDEVILFEPFFDQYIAQIKFNGGTPVFVPIRAPKAASTSNVSANDWKINLDELKKAITPRTKMIWINTPHNPIGKVFDEAELTAIGKVAEKHDLMILSDEVYDVLTFDKMKHVRIASLGDFWKRTVTVGSAGKSFAATGWRVGWCIGPAELITPLVAAHTRIVFAVNSPAQEAAAKGLHLAQENKFFPTQITEYDARRKVLLEALDKLGLPYTIPHGAYFVLLNTECLQIPDDFKVLDMIKDRARDWKAAWFVAQTAKVVLIPVTDFFSEEHAGLGENWIRVAFCKDEATLKEAGERLLKLKPFIRDA